MKIDEMIGFNGEYQNGDLMQILLFVLENREKSALQTFHRETYYFQFREFSHNPLSNNAPF